MTLSLFPRIVVALITTLSLLLAGGCSGKVAGNGTQDSGKETVSDADQSG